MRFLLLIGLLVPTTLSAQRSSYPPSLADSRQETYKRVDGRELKLWVFEPSEPAASKTPADTQRPAIVFFFGGGWKGGSPKQFEQHCRYLASRGMVAITADYRVRSRHDVLADRCVADAKSAVRWIRQNADRLGIDPDRIVAGGGSAGGHLAACTAVVPGLDEPQEPSEISSKPNALALFNPALVLAPIDGVEFDTSKLAELRKRVGVPPRRISPIHHVTGDLPPTIIFHGEADTTVPLATVRRYTEVATDAGNRCELVTYPDAAHGFFNFGRGGQPGEHFRLTLHRLDQFLQSLGYLEGDATITVPSSPNVHLRSQLERSRKTFEEQKIGTVAFIGGSITERNGFRPLVQQSLQERFPDTKFQFINAGISSTCSTTGAFRLSDDVLARNPDLLFVEFAVNDDQDAAHSARECLRGMEGILRQTRTHEPPIDVVVTHFVNPPMLSLLDNGKTPVSLGVHESVASHYGVSTIDVAQEVSDRIAAGSFSWERYGGTHPGKEGNALAAELIEEWLTAAWSPWPANVDQAVVVRDENAQGDSDPNLVNRVPKLLDRQSYVRGRWIDVDQTQHTGKWQLEVPNWSGIDGSLRERFAGIPLLCSTRVGDELILEFEGTGVGAYVLAGPDAGRVGYTIDDGTQRTLDLYHRFSRGLHYPRTVMFDADLGAGQHTLKIQILDRSSSTSGGTAVRIVAFAVNGQP